MKKNYDELYLQIIKIGRSRVNEGLSYNDLISELKCRGYDIKNDCVELAVKQWFYQSFNHYGADDNPYTCVKDLDNHQDCQFILNGDACLRLIEYDTSRKSTIAGYISLILALIAIWYTVWHDSKKEPEKSKTKFELPQGLKRSQLRSERILKPNSCYNLFSSVPTS